MNPSGRPHLLGLLAGLFLAAGLVCSAMLVTRAWVKVAEAQTIQVTGSARRNVQSDLIVWRSYFSTEADTLLEAQLRLKSDLLKVEAFLKSNGFTNYSLSPISIQRLRTMDNQQKPAGFQLTQSVEINSPEVEKVAALDRNSTALVEQGVMFSTSSSEFIYTKAGEAKIEMLAEATKDARARAEQIAEQGGRKIHQLRAAKMGVFQITPLHSLQTSWEGVNDTSSFEKTITSVVTTSFSLK